MTHLAHLTVQTTVHYHHARSALHGRFSVATSSYIDRAASTVHYTPCTPLISTFTTVHRAPLKGQVRPCTVGRTHLFHLNPRALTSLQSPRYTDCQSPHSGLGETLRHSSGLCLAAISRGVHPRLAPWPPDTNTDI
jgi:hypothetical protein